LDAGEDTVVRVVTAGNHKPVNLLYAAANFSKVCSVCGQQEIQYTK